MNRQLLLDVLPEPAPSLGNYIAGPNGQALDAARRLSPGERYTCGGRPAAGAATCCARSPVRRGPLYRRPRGTGGTGKAGAGQPGRPHAGHRSGGRPASHGRRRASGAVCLVQSLARVGGNPACLRPGRRRRPGPTGHALREDLRTWLGWDLVFRLDPLSDADKLAALSAQAAERGLQLAPEVINWMLTHYERDIKPPGRAAGRPDRYSLATRRP